MKPLLGGIGKTLLAVGFIVGGLTWLATTAYFFQNDENFLGLISLLVPPSEIVLPWVVSIELGIISVASTTCLIVGAVCLAGSEQ